MSLSRKNLGSGTRKFDLTSILPPISFKSFRKYLDEPAICKRADEQGPMKLTTFPNTIGIQIEDERNELESFEGRANYTVNVNELQNPPARYRPR